MSRKSKKQIDISLLDKIVYGRVEPHIYAFSTQTIPNYLKIGDTYRPLEKRLDEWRVHYPDLKKQYDTVAKVDDETFFRDHSAHQYLEVDAKKERLKPHDKKVPYYSREFFKNTTKNDISDAIKDIKSSYKKNNKKYKYYKFNESYIPVTHTYLRNEDYQPRPNQQATIDRFKKVVKEGRTNLLMYAVMRFGKSFTSLCCAESINAEIVLVVSAKADVKEEWKKTTESHVKFKDYEFIDSATLLQSNSALSQKLKNNKKVVIFLTLQDLQGEDVKEKHKEVFKGKINLLIIDETHFGARATEYGKVLKNLDLTKKEYKNESKLNDNSIDEVNQATKAFDADVRLHLSGTPYRILMGSEFEEKDIIAFYQFSNIAEDQKKWDEENLNKDVSREWDNPYYGFPQMIRFAFNPNESSRKKMEQLKNMGISYAFSELFRPESIIKDKKNNLHKKFRHEIEVADLLKVIDGSKHDNNLLSFLDYEKIKDGQMCRHIVCVLPYRASCDAMEKLMKKKGYKNLNKYEVINISGVDNERLFSDTQDVKNKIKDFERRGKKTITLTVNRMLTGSTVPEWDTMLYLKDTSSPQEYDQAIFRLQNQYIKTLEEANGDVLKYNLKPQTLLVDFNPNRMFRMQEHKAQIYNVNIESNGNSKLEQRISNELLVSPIVTLNKNKIVQVEPTDILDVVRDYSSQRSVLDEATSISVDMSLLDYDQIREVIERQNKIGSKEGLEIEPSDGEGDDVEVGNSDSDEATEKKVNDSNDLDSQSLEKEYKEKFAMYYARILFFALLTDARVKSLEEILRQVDKGKNNKRIAKNVELQKDILVLFQKHINPFVLSELDYKILNINSLANDTDLDPVERVNNALNKFSRLSSSEVITPQIITERIIGELPESAIRSSTKILDIASKQGEFVYSIYKKFGKTVANNLFSVPTSKIAYEFTLKVYKLLDLNTNNIEKSYTSYELIEDKKLRRKNNVKINNQFMKFDVIVGNPPYQKVISTNSKNKSLSKQIFPEFIRLSLYLEPKYLSLVTPSRWFTGDAQDKSFLRLRELFKEKNHIQRIVNIPVSSRVFPDVEISGGVNYFLYNPKHKGDVEFTEYYDEDNFVTKKRPLFEEGLDIILSSSFSYGILKKVRSSQNFQSLTEITKGRNAFGILGKNANDMSASRKKAGYYELRCKYEEIRYVDKKHITKNNNLAEKWKVFISKGNGAAGLLSDGEPVAILGKPYLARPKSVCTDSLIPIGDFSSKYEADALTIYIKTKFFRYLVGTLKTSQNVLQNVYKFVPMQDFSKNSDIDWKKPIEDIDDELYQKYKLTKKEISHIEDSIKVMS